MFTDVISMTIKPDDYYNDGIFEMVRAGRYVSLRNLMTPEQNKKYVVFLKGEYPKYIAKINELVVLLRDKIVACDPIQLLSFASDCTLMSIGNHFSEIDMTKDEISTARMTEYIQSVMVSSHPECKPTDNGFDSDPSGMFFSIQKDIEDLYDLIYSYYSCMATSLEEQYPDYDPSVLIQLFESQTLFLVRGQRYQVFEAEYFKGLLDVHNDIFMKVFNLSAIQILEGYQSFNTLCLKGKQIL